MAVSYTHLQGQMITIRPHTRFVAFPRHSHNYVEIMYVCTGQITHIIGGGTTAVSYTHLDVYKRQDVYELTPARCWKVKRRCASIELKPQ